jgi:hypothetical protein
MEGKIIMSKGVGSMARLAAFIVLLIPGIIAAGGIKIMRDSLFGKKGILEILPIWVHFIIGFIMFALGIGFFAGFLLNRDRKNGRVQEKFKKKNGL